MSYISKGKRMMLFVNDHPVAFATNNTLTITPSIIEERTKDDGDGAVGDFDGYTWSMSVESLVGNNSPGQSMASIVNNMVYLGKSRVVTDAATPATGAHPADGWAQGANVNNYPYSSGEAYTESLTISAGVSGSATMSVTFRGIGELS